MSASPDSPVGNSEFDNCGEGPKENEKRSVVRVDYDLCEVTGACIQVCPEDVFEMRGGHPRIIQAEACTECWICVENCCSGAIEIG